MSWAAVALLALGAFALAAFACRLERRWWTSLLAALSLGLAGYAIQARPDLPSAARSDAPGREADPWASLEERRALVSSRYRSSSNQLLTSDAFARQGQYANAAAMARSATEENPADAEAWLALGNALVEHADGTLTPAALHALRRAGETAPDSLAPGYFLGLALIRQGQFLEGREIWERTLAGAGAGATGGDRSARAMMAERLERLDTLLLAMGAVPQAGPAGAAEAP